MNRQVIRMFAAKGWQVGATAVGMLVLTSQMLQAGPELTDQAISDAVEDEFVVDHAVVSSKIDTATIDGIVTLTGTVNNILAKERAARIAETVRGVRAVVNRIEVDALPRSDVELEQDIKRALLIDPATESYEISADADDGIVTLRGTVDSYQEAELVKTVVKGVLGVRAIEDQIDIDYAVDRLDYEIQTEIAAALRWNTYVDDYLIDVAVNDGTVTLSGTVGSAAEKRQAAAEAWVAGVRAVNDADLIVDRWARDEALRGDKFVVKSETELVDAVKDAFVYDPRVNSFNVDVKATGSMVTLRGTVDNLQARRAAEQDALHTVGVSMVDNRLRVRPVVTTSDAEIADDVREALGRDPFVERFDVTVAVVDGTVHLYGTVDSSYEKNRADDIASRVLGVVDVDNHVRVDVGGPYVYDPYVDSLYPNRDELGDYEPRRPWMTDGQLKQAIEDELWWSPFVDEDEVTVAVDDGVARLTGTVDTWRERQAATDNAYEAGATLVDNDLLVEQG